MKKHLLPLLLIITASIASAQPKSKAVAGVFMQKFNSGNYSGIYDTLFSQTMRNAMSFDKSKTFLTSLNTQAGVIKSFEYGSTQGGYDTYKTTFERGVFNLSIALNDSSLINGLFLKPYTATIERNKTEMILPLKGEWFVFWGGDTKQDNYHINVPFQKNAFDFVVTNHSGATHNGEGRANENYYAFGKEIIAPCDGKVVLAVDGIKDNTPGEMNQLYLLGNAVIIKTANNEFLYFAHFKQGSVSVKQGDRVKQGQLLGLCGNSGNSSEPHLHFHIQNKEDIKFATGIKCYFKEVKVGQEIKRDYSPLKSQKVSNN